MNAFVCRPAIASDAEAIAALFAASDCRCHCRYFHFEGDKNAWLERCFTQVEDNRREFQDALASENGEASGIVALRDAEAIGWLKVAPAEVMQKAFEQRYYRGLPMFTGLPRERAFLIGCGLVAQAARAHGVFHRMVECAIRFAKAHGRDLVVALPRVGEGLRSDEVWTGPLAAYERAGFTKLDGELPYPVLVKQIEQTASEA
jgi:GNAT superfamily N-acetyltransferase